eukprot:TRINITY_DN1390_c0_g4_i1.p1 TRINITY_DN1390_c0_g4~~TRINITY_DN1390_c0_g4_i1.p1  ORF type:complete len:257 (-),score=28.10 TRINITY_DN1390_c0_g4_i1:433-1203(-)
MQGLIVVWLLFGVVGGCSIVGPLPTFDELFLETEFVISGKIIDMPVYELMCPNSGSPIYKKSGEPVEVGEQQDNETALLAIPNFDFEPNATAVVEVSCVHKGTITCYTPNGYKVKGPGSVFEEQCLVYVHSIDTVTSCGYFIEPSDTQYTFLMKSDGQVPEDVPNKQCYDSTFALEDHLLNAINSFVPETCPYPTPQYPDCPEWKCFNVVSEACCGFASNCFVPRLNLDYEYLGKCGQNQEYYKRTNSILGECYCE